jgi:protoporphyrin/coproporphyrin ferrochelatase
MASEPELAGARKSDAIINGAAARNFATGRHRCAGGRSRDATGLDSERGEARGGSSFRMRSAESRRIASRRAPRPRRHGDSTKVPATGHDQLSPDRDGAAQGKKRAMVGSGRGARTRLSRYARHIMPRRAVLLVNLGSPDSPGVEDVRRYLREFLGDERVLDVPAPLRWLLLEGVILRTRPSKSAHAYASIWTADGSPLMRTSRRVRDKLSAAIGAGTPVYLAMRYGNPSIADVVGEIAADGIEELLLIPQYPHYAMSSWETVVVRVEEELRRQAARVRLTCVRPFYADPDYIAALHTVAAPYLAQPHDHVLFSYHGVPVRHLRKYNCTRGRAARVDDCCPANSASHATCYRSQVLATTRAFAAQAGLAPGRYSVSFQSRLAGEPWCEPFTDQELTRLPATGVKRLLVLCPAFVADCLETLEEIAEAGKKTFLAAGGVRFELIPCFNDHPAYVEFLRRRIEAWASDPRHALACASVGHLSAPTPVG